MAAPIRFGLVGGRSSLPGSRASCPLPMHEAAASGEAVKSVRQPWAGQLT